MVKIVGIIQARALSQRLPLKVLAPIVETRSLLEVLYERLKVCEIEWWLATTETQSDLTTALVGEALGMRVFRGSETNVLSRFSSICKETTADWCVRITADNPYTSGATVSKMISQIGKVNDSYSLLRGPKAKPFYPLGFCPEVIRAKQVLTLDEELHIDSPHREHVTSAIGEDACLEKVWDDGPAMPHLRWTVDHHEDLDRARQDFKIFGTTWRSIQYPEMTSLLAAET